MAVTLKGQSAIYEGTSADMKPSDADNNAIFKELDTGIRYYYDGTDWNEIPSSGGGGGGTGTDNYNELSNKPQINSVTLSGNKSLDALGIQAQLTFDTEPTEDSTNPVESGGVYSVLSTKQDTLIIDATPTENSSNPVQSGGTYTALAGKQDTLTFEGTYNASSNRAATESTVSDAIKALDVAGASSIAASKTISAWSETDGKASISTQDIAIAGTQAVLTGYTPESPSQTDSILATDTVNAAIKKLDERSRVDENNILLYQPDLKRATSFSGTTTYSMVSDCTIEIPSGDDATVYRISAMLGQGSAGIRGIILSKTNDSSTFDTDENVLCKAEQATGLRNTLSCSDIWFNSSDNPRYVYCWVKLAVSGTGRVYTISERLG